MSEYQPKEGDRVRVVIEGPVFHVDKLHRFADIGDLGRRHTVPLLGEPVVVSVEKLPDPEPEWREGDIVRCAVGSVYRRLGGRAGDRVWQGFTGVVYREDVPRRPLTRLVDG